MEQCMIIKFYGNNYSVKQLKLWVVVFSNTFMTYPSLSTHSMIQAVS